MLNRLNKLLDSASEFFAERKGLLPLVGLLFVIVNAILQFLPSGWLGESDLLLHLGIVLAILGFLLGWAL